MPEFYTSVVQLGNAILLRGVRDGVHFKERVRYQPYHYVVTDQAPHARTLDGRSLRRVDFDDINSAKGFLEKYEGVENANVFGFRRYAYPFIRDRFPDMEYDYDQVNVVYFDIEVAADQGFPSIELADKEVTAISLRKGDLRVVFACVDYEPTEGVVYVRCNSESDLLGRFIDAWIKLDPDIISGWNCEFFDIPYLVNRITNVLGEDQAKKLSPWGILHEYSQKSKFGSEQSSYRLLGLTVVDLMQAYIKFSFKNQESFSLNHIAHVELGEKKIDYSEYESLHDLYLKDPQKFIEYNVLDSDLVYRINQKTGLINQIITLAYDAGINYADAFGSVLMWEVIIDNHLHSKGVATPSFSKRNRKEQPIMGAFVKEPLPGKYEWGVGLDLDGLYPHLMMQYNISPETMVKCYRDLRFQLPIEDIIENGLQGNQTVRQMMEKGLGYTPNGAFFRNDVRGFLGELMDKFYQDRKRFKKEMLRAKDELNEIEKAIKRRSEQGLLASKVAKEAEVTQLHNLQLAKKIALNSMYGSLSNEFFAFFDLDLAEAITYAGQLAIKWIAHELNMYLNKILGTTGVDLVIASDTDSCYLNLGPLVDKMFDKDTDREKIAKFLVKVCEEKINPFINESYDRLKDLTQAYENRMSMKVESIFDAGLWRAKKKYALYVRWDEGVLYEKPKVKIKGLSAIQSSTPEMCRDSIKEAIEIVLTGTKSQLTDHVAAFEKRFNEAPFEDIAKTSSVSDMEKYADPQTVFAKGTPIHVRGSLIYNDLIRRMKVDNVYQRIRSGDKVKFCYLTLPNPVRSDSISIYNRLPPEFGLSDRIDRNKQFNTVYLNPVNDISKLVGWDLVNTATLESLFE